MASLGDGVERLLTLHTQRDFLLSDRSRRSLSELHATLEQSDEDEELELTFSAAEGPQVGQNCLCNSGL